MNSILEVRLEDLKPTRPARIMDLVSDAGVNVEPWAKKKDGTEIVDPAKNPHYCYDWAFGGGAEPTVLCVWHSKLRDEGGRIVYRDNMRDLAIKLERVADERFRPAKEKSRAKSQAPRAQDFDRQLQAAFRKNLPVRVVTLVGDERDGDAPGIDAAKVEKRLLDPSPWH